MMSHSETWALTDRQRAALDSLVCERLTANSEANRAALKAFENKRVSKKGGVLGHLCESGSEDDNGGETAVYVVKAKDGTGLLAFSLKCSELFLPLFESKADFQAYYRERFFQDMEGVDEDEKEILFENWSAYSFIEKKTNASKDAQGDRNKKNMRVSKTHSGILLVDFCKNDSFAAQQVWKALDMPSHRSVGEVLFWLFLVPIVLQVHDCVGCRQLFLFSADGLDENRKLMSYYEEILGFQEELLWGANKPSYDNCCWLMSQSVSEMRHSRERFISTFNRPRGLSGR